VRRYGWGVVLGFWGGVFWGNVINAGLRLVGGGGGNRNNSRHDVERDAEEKESLDTVETGSRLRLHYGQEGI